MQNTRTLILLSFLFMSLFVLTAGSQPVQWDTLAAIYPSLLYSSSDLHGFRQRIINDSKSRALYLQILSQSRARSNEQITRSRIAKSGAFAMSIGMKEDGGLLTEGEISSITDMLNTYFHEIDPVVQANNSEYQWRAVELMQFCEAYDFYRGWSMPADTAVERTLATFADGMQRELGSALLMYNNLTLKLAGAMGMSALTLRSSQLPDVRSRSAVWISKSLDFIEKAFFQNLSSIDGTAGYSEGPYYFRYGMMNLLPFFQALDRVCGSSPLAVNGKTYTNPIHDARYQRIFEWIADIRMPDGRLPAFEDTYMDTRFPELAILGQIGPKNGHLAWKNYTGTAPLDESALYIALSETYDSRIEYFCAGAMEQNTPSGTPLVSLKPDAGYAVYRSAWTPEATYFALIGKHGVARTGGSSFGSGHKHANETGFILAAAGELLAMEPGYYQYSYRDSLIFGRNHNIILVDGKGPDRTSLLSFIIGADTFISDTLSSQWGSVATAATTYENTNIIRTAVFFNNKFVILRDKVTATAPRDLTHQIHGNGLESAGTFTGPSIDGTCSWLSGDMRLHANVTCIKQHPLYESVTRKHAPTYRVFADHSAMYTTVTAQTATFHTALVPVPSSTQVSIGRIDSAFNAHAVSCVAGSDIFASSIALSNSSFRVKTNLGIIEADAPFGIMGADQTTEVTLFLENATHLKLNDKLVFSCNGLSTLFTRIGAQEVDITIKTRPNAQFSLYLNYEPDTIIGTGFSAFMNGNRLYVNLANGRADMKIILSGTPTGIEESTIADGPEIQALYPNPATSEQSAITIRYSIPSGDHVTIALYNALGQSVRQLESADKAPGAHTSTVQLGDVPKGMYFLEITTSRGTQRKAFAIQ